MWVLEPRDLERLLVAVEESGRVVIDLETTGLDEHATTGGLSNGGVAARVSLASLTLPRHWEDEYPTTWVLPLSHPESPWSGTWAKVLRQVAEAVKVSGAGVINQNMKFDSRWIRATTGIDLASQIIWDTQQGSHILDENTPTALKERAPAVFGVERWDDFDLKTPGASEKVPLFDLGMYAARDTYWTWRLAQRQRYLMFVGSRDEPETPEDVRLARLGQVAEMCAMPTVRTLTAIEQRGILLDVPWVTARTMEHEQMHHDLFEELRTLYPEHAEGAASFAPTATWFREWSETAVEKGDLRIAALTKTGKAQWTRDVLARQARQGSVVAEKLLNLRDSSKKLEFLHAWLSQVSAGGRIYSTYHSASVVTGRLSSSGPNMQQVTYALRPAFMPSPGYYIADIDYSQIELRVAAFISECQPMINAFKRGDDLHTLLAQRIIHAKSAAEVTPEARQKGKSANFGLLYGMGAYGFKAYAESAYGVEMDEAEAAQIHRTFFEMWEGLGEWHAKMARIAQRDGQVVSPIGRIRRLPDIYSFNEERVLASERAAINAPVQGFASDLMQMASASIEGELAGHERVAEARLVGTVHDSILVEVPIDGWEEVTRECMERMVNIPVYVEQAFGVQFDVPLEAEANVGTRWGLNDVGTLK